MQSRLVIAEWEAAYAHPISLEEGEEFWLTGKTDSWDGHIWVWARNRAGREGWVPDSLGEYVSGKTYDKIFFSA